MAKGTTWSLKIIRKRCEDMDEDAIHTPSFLKTMTLGLIAGRCDPLNGALTESLVVQDEHVVDVLVDGVGINGFAKRN